MTHDFCNQKTVKIADLAGEPLILLGKGSVTRQRVESYLQRGGKVPKVAMELSSFEIIKRYVAAELGVSLVPKKAVTDLIPGLAAVSLQQSLNIKVGIVYRRDRTLSHPATVFLKMAKVYFAKNKGLVSGSSSKVSGPSRN